MFSLVLGENQRGVLQVSSWLPRIELQAVVQPSDQVFNLLTLLVELVSDNLLYHELFFLWLLESGFGQLCPVSELSRGFFIFFKVLQVKNRETWIPITHTQAVDSRVEALHYFKRSYPLLTQL